MKPLDRSELKTNMEIIVFNKRSKKFRKDVVTFVSNENHPGKRLISLRSTGIANDEPIFYLDNPKTETWLLLQQKKLLQKTD